MRLSVAQLRQLTGTDQSGTSVFGLVEASKQLGFLARAVKAEADELSTVAFPAIAHVALEGAHLHYLVVLRMTKRRITVMDPAVGRFEKYSPEDFQAIWTGVLILMAPGTAFQPTDQQSSRLSWYLRLLKPHRSTLIQALFGAILGTFLALTGSFYIQKVVDSVIVESNAQLLNLLSVCMLLVLAFQVVLNIGQNLLFTKSGQNLDLTLILSYYRHLFTLPQTFFDGMRVGEMVSRINDAVKIRTFLNQQGATFVVCALTLVFAVLVMFVFSLQLALLSVVFLAIYSVLFVFAVWRNRLFSRRIMEQSADFDAQIVESLEMASTLRRFDRQWIAEMKTESLLVRLLNTTYSSGLFGIGINALGSIVVQGFTIALLWIGASSVMQAQMSPGQLISCFALMGYLTGPANSLLSIIVSALEMHVAADRLFEILDLESEESSGTIELDDISPLEIRLEDITFGYPGRVPILKNGNARFLQGEIAVLRGASGCGKSSILALLQRFYHLTAGQILFGQYNIRYIRPSSLRSRIAVVPQKIDLMSGTVIENIALGEFEPDMQRIINICTKVGILDFIQSLPAGFATKLAESGRDLSGGQRQRLAIARALHTDAPIYLFDEPTAALDEISEKRFLQILNELRELGKVVVLVTHDDRLMSFADRVYEVANCTIEPVSLSDRSDAPRRQIMDAKVEGGECTLGRVYRRAGAPKETGGLTQSVIVSMSRILGLRPKSRRNGDFLRDPCFAERAHDIVGIYLNAEAEIRAIVLRLEESSIGAASGRRQLALTMPLKGECADDQCHQKSASLVTALNEATGKTIPSTGRGQPYQDFLRFLEKIDREIPRHLEIHIVLDRATLNVPQIASWFKRRPRYHLHSTPNSESWTREAKRCVDNVNKHPSRHLQFERAILGYLEVSDQTSKPFVWTASQTPAS